MLQRIWLEVTIVGGIYLVSFTLLFIRFFREGYDFLIQVIYHKELVSIVAILFIIVAYVTGLAVLEIQGIVYRTASSTIRKIFHKDPIGKTFKEDYDFVVVWQFGSDRVIRGLDGSASKVSYYFLMSSAMPFLGVSSAVFAWGKADTLGLIITAVLMFLIGVIFYLMLRKKRRAHDLLLLEAIKQACYAKKCMAEQKS